MNITIITPAKRGDRSGNRATANRWATILRKLGHIPRTITQYDGRPCDAMLAIHAWRSADSILRYRDAFPHSPLIVCLAGTDIYRFQKSHPEATHQSMRHADYLVCLHDWVDRAIPKAQREKLHVIHQSAALKTPPTLRRHFEILVAGHLRDETSVPHCSCDTAVDRSAVFRLYISARRTNRHMQRSQHARCAKIHVIIGLTKFPDGKYANKCRERGRW